MIKMSHKWRKERGQYYHERVAQAWADTTDLRNKRDAIRELYYKEPGGFDAETPWKGASDIHLPVILDKIETAVPKIVSSTWRADPFVNVRPTDPSVPLEAAKNVEHFISWAFRNDIPDYYLTSSNFERNKLLDGTAFQKIRWNRKYRKTIEVHTIPAVLYPGDKDILGAEVTVARDKTIDEVLQEVFGYGDPNNTFYDVKKLGKKKYSIDFTEDGEKFTAIVELAESRRISDVDVRVRRNIIENDSPDISNVDFEDLLFPVRSETLQKASWVAHRTWYPLSKIRRMRDKGTWIFTPEEFAAVEASATSTISNNTMHEQKDLVLGVTDGGGEKTLDSTGAAQPNMVMMWEVYCEDNVDDDDDPVKLVLYIPGAIKTVVGIEYLDDMVPHGRVPFVSDTFIPIDGRVYGIGMAELLYGINLSMDKTINEINNALAVKANPWALYSAFGMASNSKALTGIAPGEFVPVGDVNGIKFPDFAQEPLQMFHGSFSTLQGFADSLTFSPMIGGSSNFRNAPRTAHGTVALMGAAEEKLSGIVEKAQASSWKEMVRQVVSLYAAYTSIDKWYRVTGETEMRRISPKELRQNWQFEYTGSLTSVNREVQQALAERRYMALRIDPLYQQDPHAHQALIDDYLKHMTSGEDHSALVPKLAGEGGFPHAPMSQESEIRIMSFGKAVEVLPIDDHANHIDVLERFIKSDAFETIPAYAVSVIKHHLDQHEQMASNVQNMQGQGNLMGGPQPMPMMAPEPGVPVDGMSAAGGIESMLQGGPM